MIIGTTPTFTLKLKRTYDVNLREANNVYVTLKQGTILLNKTTPNITIVDDKTVQFSLSQTESLQFALDKPIELQLNWTYRIGGVSKRAATKTIEISLEKQLLKQEIN